MTFIHCNTEKYIKHRKYILWLTLFPLFQGALITALIMLVNLRAFYESGLLKTAACAAVAAALLGTLFFYAVYILTERAVSRNARYTYFEISPKAVIFSRYGGWYISGGRRVIARKLYIIPFSELKSIGYNEKSGAVYLEAGDPDNPGIKKYLDRSDRLNYKITGGQPVFEEESWWYNENGYKKLDLIKIPKFFGEPEELCRKIAEAKREFESLPKPKPYVHKEAAFVRRRKALAKFKKYE